MVISKGFEKGARKFGTFNRNSVPSGARAKNTGIRQVQVYLVIRKQSLGSDDDDDDLATGASTKLKLSLLLDGFFLLDGLVRLGKLLI